MYFSSIRAVPLLTKLKKKKQSCSLFSKNRNMGDVGDYKPEMAMFGLQFAYAAVAISCILLFNSYTFLLKPVDAVKIYQNLYFEGVHLASSSTASAMLNLLPAFTFIMASISGYIKCYFL